MCVVCTALLTNTTDQGRLHCSVMFCWRVCACACACVGKQWWEAKETNNSVMFISSSSSSQQCC